MEHNATKCPGCGKGTVVMVETTGGAVDYDYICSRQSCDWICADPERAVRFRKRERKLKLVPKKKHSSGVKFREDSDEFKAELRDEIERRLKRLRKERAKLPKKLNDKQRAHLHTFYVDAVEIREELLHA